MIRIGQMNSRQVLCSLTSSCKRLWVFGSVLLVGCQTLDSKSEYAVYYYDAFGKVAYVEKVEKGHNRKAYAPFRTPPALAPQCTKDAYPPIPGDCIQAICPLTITKPIVKAVYYGQGKDYYDPDITVWVNPVGVETSGPFEGRVINMPSGAGCNGSPACSKKCCAPSAGGCVCIC